MFRSTGSMRLVHYWPSEPLQSEQPSLNQPIAPEDVGPPLLPTLWLDATGSSLLRKQKALEPRGASCHRIRPLTRNALKFNLGADRERPDLLAMPLRPASLRVQPQYCTIQGTSLQITILQVKLCTPGLVLVSFARVAPAARHEYQPPRNASTRPR